MSTLQSLSELPPRTLLRRLLTRTVEIMSPVAPASAIDLHLVAEGAIKKWNKHNANDGAHDEDPPPDSLRCPSDFLGGAFYDFTIMSALAVDTLLRRSRPICGWIHLLPNPVGSQN